MINEVMKYTFAMFGTHGHNNKVVLFMKYTLVMFGTYLTWSL